MDEKHCSRCEQTKPIDQFNWKITGERRQTYCRSCQSAYTKDHYRRNPEAYRARARAARARAKKWTAEYLAQHPCVDCGRADTRVLVFDHVTGVKHKEVTTMANDGYSIARIKEEVEKCQVRCANCHRIRHHEERIGA